MAIAPSYMLTVDLVTISGLDVAGTVVTVELANPGLRSIGPPGFTETLYPTTLTRTADASGIIMVPLLPSPLVGNYRVTVGGFSRVVAMPEADSRLSEFREAAP